MLELEYSSRVLDDGRIHTTLRDITQRKANEARLRTSLERLHEIVQTQQEIAALELDPNTIAAMITERAQRLAGAEGAVIQWFEGDDQVYRFASGIAEAVPRPASDPGHRAAGPRGEDRRDRVRRRHRDGLARRGRALPSRGRALARVRPPLDRRRGRRHALTRPLAAERVRPAGRRDDPRDGGVRQHRLPQRDRARDAAPPRRRAPDPGAGRRAHADGALDLEARERRPVPPRVRERSERGRDDHRPPPRSSASRSARSSPARPTRSPRSSTR